MFSWVNCQRNVAYHIFTRAFSTPRTIGTFNLRNPTVRLVWLQTLSVFFFFFFSCCCNIPECKKLSLGCPRLLHMWTTKGILFSDNVRRDAKSLFHRQCFARECDSSRVNDGVSILYSSFCTTEDKSGRVRPPARSLSRAWLQRNKKLQQIKRSLLDVCVRSRVVWFCANSLIDCLHNWLSGSLDYFW